LREYKKSSFARSTKSSTCELNLNPSSQLCSDVVGKRCIPQILVNLSLTNVHSHVSCNEKILGLKHLQLPDMTARCWLQDGACVAHQGAGVTHKAASHFRWTDQFSF
jgi:hypothetical protein